MQSDDTPLSALEQAVLQTISYADIFNYPLKPAEVHRYLVGKPATRTEIDSTLSQLVSQQQIGYMDGYAYLAGREGNVTLRYEREAISSRMWPLARHYAQIIGSLPFVRMVAVTGSLAVDNLEREGDIDYLIVTAPGRLWSVRLMVIGLVKLAARRGITLCPNYLITTEALTMQDHNLFVAREMAQMVPLVGQETYDQLLDSNPWIQDYLPNVADMSEITNRRPFSLSLFKGAGELLLRTPPAAWLERWEMNRKVRKLAAQNPHADEADFSANQCKGHTDGHMIRVLTAYQVRTVNRSTEQVAAQPSQAAIIASDNQKVLFGQSYYLHFDAKLYRAMQPYPPLGTLYAAAYIREQGYDVAVFDAMLASSETEWHDALRREQPRYAVIYEDNFNYLSKMCLSRMRQAADTMIDMAKQQGCTVIVAGSDATDHYAHYLDAGADYVLLGEGEESLRELLAALQGGETDAISDVQGVVSHETESPVRRRVMKALDSLPMPAWDLVDIERYRQIWGARHGYFSMNLVTTRGCPYHCNWCAKPIWGQRYNVHSPERVAEMMAWLKERYSPDHIWFADDIMGLKPGWLERFAEALDDAVVHLPFKCLSRADLLLRGDTINAMARAGCDEVWIGAESGSQKILDAMEKGTRVEEIREAALKLREAGVKVGFFLQFGYPGETRSDIAKTLGLVREVMPDDIGISVSYPLPGTKFYDRVKDQFGLQDHWADSSDMAMLYQGPFTTTFYRQLHTVVHKEFRSRHTLRRLPDLLRNPRRLREVAAMIYHGVTLPLSRLRLSYLERQPHPGGIALTPALDYAQAATPTPQDETPRGTS